VAPDERTVDVFVKLIRNPQFTGTGVGVLALNCLLLKLLIVLSDSNEQVHLFRIEEILDEQVPVTVKLVDLFLVQDHVSSSC
jgi:hypothetical protein